MTTERRLQVADMTARGMTPDQIAKELGYSTTKSVYKAQANPDVKEQIAWHRDNLFSQSRIDRVDLLKELFQRATAPTGPIFATLQGADFHDNILLASQLPKLTDLQSRMIQQIEIEPTSVLTDEVDEEGNQLSKTVSIIKKIRFHSPDAALKILSKAAGFEDGLPAKGEGGEGGPFRGMTIVPPTEFIDMVKAESAPPEKPKHSTI